MTSSSRAPGAASISTSLIVSLTTLPPLSTRWDLPSRLSVDLARQVLRPERPVRARYRHAAARRRHVCAQRVRVLRLAIRIAAARLLEVCTGLARERLAVAVHVLEDIHGIV